MIFRAVLRRSSFYQVFCSRCLCYSARFQVVQAPSFMSPRPNARLGKREARLNAPVLEAQVEGTTIWFDAEKGYGFVKRNSSEQHLFVHFTSIAKKNPDHALPSLEDGEAVIFDVIRRGEKGFEAVRVTGPGGAALRGSPYAKLPLGGFRLDTPGGGSIPAQKNQAFSGAGFQSYSTPNNSNKSAAGPDHNRPGYDSSSATFAARQGSGA